MSHETNRIRYILPKLSRGNYNTLMKLLSPTLSDPVKFRLHVLGHYYKYGIRSTCNAFNLPRTTIYTWKRNYELAGKNKYSLIPKSTRPHYTRTQTLNPKLVEFIKAMRMEYDNIGRLKIKYFLDEYAKGQNLNSYGTTKIGIIIKRKGFTFAKKKKGYKKAKPLISRVKRSPRETMPGYIEMDTVHLWVLGRKHYFVTAMDVVTRYAWVSLAKSPSSKWTTHAFKQFTRHYKQKVRMVQADNGNEFLKDFHKYLEQGNIKHEFIYPRSPKVNGYIERFNRTFKEEFLYKYELDIKTNAFNHKLIKYLTWYNTQRPHYSLNMKSPTAYMQQFN